MKKYVLPMALAGLIASSALAVSALSVSPLPLEPMPPLADASDLDNFDGGMLPAMGAFNRFAGTIIADTAGDTYMVMLENAEGDRTEFVITPETYRFEGVNLHPNNEIVGFYATSGFAPAIYPPRYTAAVVAPVWPDRSVYVGRFDADLVSTDNELKINVSDDTIVTTTDGRPYTGPLAGRDLAVVYSIATRSIPAQTTPIQIVVLPEVGTPIYEDEAAHETELDAIEGIEQFPIVVENVMTSARARIGADGAVMVPLRAIAEGLGYTVTWDGDTQSIMLNAVHALQIGRDSYSIGRMAPIELGTAPTLLDGVTFVPLTFFRDIVQANNVYIFEGHIFIDNMEKMQ